MRGVNWLALPSAIALVAMLRPPCATAFHARLSVSAFSRRAVATSSASTRWVQLKRWEANTQGRCDSLMQRILRAEQASRPLIGSWNCIGSPEVTEVLADSGMDFVCLDMEHSCMSLETVAHNIRAAQVHPPSPFSKFCIQ
jgi:hypothetical protein